MRLLIGSSCQESWWECRRHGKSTDSITHIGPGENLLIRICFQILLFFENTFTLPLLAFLELLPSRWFGRFLAHSWSAKRERLIFYTIYLKQIVPGWRWKFTKWHQIVRERTGFNKWIFEWEELSSFLTKKNIATGETSRCERIVFWWPNTNTIRLLKKDRM